MKTLSRFSFNKISLGCKIMFHRIVLFCLSVFMFFLQRLKAYKKHFCYKIYKLLIHQSLTNAMKCHTHPKRKRKINLKHFALKLIFSSLEIKVTTIYYFKYV